MSAGETPAGATPLKSGEAAEKSPGLRRLVLAIGLTLTVVSLLLLLFHLFSPVKLDTTALGLVAIAALPWLALYLSEIELPGGFKFKLRELVRAETAKLTKDLSDQKQELDNQRQELDDVQALTFLLAHFLNKRQLDILSHLDNNTPSYWLQIDPKDLFLRHELSQMLSLGLIEPITEGKWVFDNPGWRDIAEYHKITEQGREYLKMLKEVENKVGTFSLPHRCSTSTSPSRPEIPPTTAPGTTG